VLRTQFLDDFRTRGGPVANEFIACVPLKTIDKFAGKRGKFSREDIKSLLKDNTGKLPMAGSGVLAPGFLGQRPKRSQRLLNRRTAG